MIKNPEYKKSPAGTVFNIQRFSINDGAGIRSVVFLKGCPLRCPWCSNPESQESKIEILYNSGRCLRCGSCSAVCSKQCILPDEQGFRLIDRDLCNSCSQCASVCNSNALSVSGSIMSARQVVEVILKDQACYRKSGGGVTLSGGEPLMQHEFAREILKLCKENSISTAMETSGFAPATVLESVAPYVDTFLFDIKHLDSTKHLTVIGVDNQIILSNLVHLCETSTNVIIRIPLIPGFNSDIGYLARLRDYVIRLGIREIHLLPYHIWGQNKYGFLGRTYNLDLPAMEEDVAQRLQQELQNSGCIIKLHG